MLSEVKNPDSARRGSYPVHVSQYDTYQSPLAARNASPEMLRIWSPRHKFNTWRRIWLAVAEAQQACGLEITDEQIAELRAVVERGITDENLARASEIEQELRHDVMAHVHCLGEQCPKAKPIIHLGMTSQDVVCNGDLLFLTEATQLLERKLQRVVVSLADFAASNIGIPTLGFTHYQPAQPTTVGRRAANWAYDLWRVYMSLEVGDTGYFLRGFRGATGTQASFLALFDGDGDRVDEFEQRAMCFLRFGREDYAKLNERWEEHRHLGTCAYDLTGQTYPRALDAQVLSETANVASVLHKIATDIRLLVTGRSFGAIPPPTKTPPTASAVSARLPAWAP